MRKKLYPLPVFAALLTLLLLGTLLPGGKAEASDVQVNSLSQALDFATRYVETKYPYTKGETIVEDYREITRSAGNWYNVFFKRVIQGTEFPDNNIFLSIDTSGKIIMEQINWDQKLQFPSSGAKISEEAAKEAFLKQIQPLTSYRTPDQASRGEAKQRYVEYWINQENRIDAETGQLLGEKSASAGEPVAMKKTEPKETQGVPKTQTASSAKPLITKDDALQRALLMVKPPRGAGAPINIYTNAGGINDSLNGPFWNVYWTYFSKTFETGYCSARVQLQQSTGLLVDYFNYCPIEGGREVSEKEAKQKATDFVNQFASEYTQDLVLSDVRLEKTTISSLGEASHYLVYFLKHTRGGTENGWILVNIDKASGEVACYTNTLSEPIEDLQLDETKLKAMLINKFDMKLSYEAVEGSGFGAVEKSVPAGDVKPVTLKLVYRPVVKKNYIDYFLDAKEGVWRNSVTAEAVLEEQIQSGK